VKEREGKLYEKRTFTKQNKINNNKNKQANKQKAQDHHQQRGRNRAVCSISETRKDKQKLISLVRCDE